MPRVGCFVLAVGSDGRPPLIAMSRTPLREARTRSLRPSVKIGRLEATHEADWLIELCGDILSLAKVYGQLEGSIPLAEDSEPAIARVHYDGEKVSFIITADLAMIETRGALDALEERKARMTQEAPPQFSGIVPPTSNQAASKLGTAALTL